MSQFTAIRYDSAADIIASAHAVRMRLMKPKNAVKPVVAIPAPVIQLQPTPKADAPLWKREPTNFNDHVVRWQWSIVKRGGKLTQFISRRSEELGVSYADVMGNSLDRRITGARQMIWYELRTIHNLSYLHIGAICGRDHSSIIHGVKRVSAALASDVPSVVNDTSRIIRDRELNAVLREECRLGVSQAALSDTYNLSRNAIQRISKLENWPRENRSSILKYDLAGIKKAYYDGRLLADISKEFGIHSRTLAGMRRTLGWPNRDKVAARADAEMKAR